jgi:hypothetical protein
VPYIKKHRVSIRQFRTRTPAERRAAARAAEQPADYTHAGAQDELEAMSYNDLRAHAAELGVDSTGSKAAILERLRG